MDAFVADRCGNYQLALSDGARLGPDTGVERAHAVDTAPHN